MGASPPVDAPEPSAQAEASASVEFAPSPTGADLCGFKIPSFSFNLGFNVNLVLPGIPFPQIPTLALKCDLSDPIDLEFGGGRVGSAPEEDPELNG